MKTRNFTYDQAAQMGNTHTDTLRRVWVREPSLDYEFKGQMRAVYVMDDQASAKGAQQRRELEDARRARRMATAAEWLAMPGPATSAAKMVATAIELDHDDLLAAHLPQLIVERTAARLQKSGWKRKHKSGKGSGSIYLANAATVLRISNHTLPMHEEREYNHSHGRKAANLELVIEGISTPEEVAEQLIEVLA